MTTIKFAMNAYYLNSERYDKALQSYDRLQSPVGVCSYKIGNGEGLHEESFE